MSEIKPWSKDNNLAFNKTKTKVFPFSGSRLSSHNDLDKNELIENFSTCDKIEGVKSKKLLGDKFDQHLKFEEHFTNVVKQFALSKRKIKSITPYKLDKQLQS